MTVETTSIGACHAREATARKRKPHKKSRAGCRNCKMRSVKCDEHKPMCYKCVEYGVLCNYNSSIPDLQARPVATEVVSWDSTIDDSPLNTAAPLLDMINISLQEPSSEGNKSLRLRQLDKADLARLDKFQMRTVLTIGTKKTARLFQKEVAHLACQHLFLMHLVQSVTAAHDRYLCKIATSRPSTAEAYHMHQAITMFQAVLAQPVRNQDRDALLVAASLLGVVSFFNIEATSLEDVWPMHEGDMTWLSLSEGKRAVWNLVTPLRKDSLFRPLSAVYEKNHWAATLLPTFHTSSDHAPTVFDHLCDQEPYGPVAAELIALLELEVDDSTWIRFLGFLCQVDLRFKQLLAKRDPWALLMLAYWYKKLCRGSWWVASRSVVQGLAICLYLERYHADDEAIQSAMTPARDELRAAQSEGWGGISSQVMSPKSPSCSSVDISDFTM